MTGLQKTYKLFNQQLRRTDTSSMNPCRVRNVSDSLVRNVSCVFLRICHASTCRVRATWTSGEKKIYSCQMHLKRMRKNTLP